MKKQNEEQEEEPLLPEGIEVVVEKEKEKENKLKAEAEVWEQRTSKKGSEDKEEATKILDDGYASELELGDVRIRGQESSRELCGLLNWLLSQKPITVYLKAYKVKKSQNYTG